jgi:hypothetical protein
MLMKKLVIALLLSTALLALNGVWLQDCSAGSGDPPIRIFLTHPGSEQGVSGSNMTLQIFDDGNPKGQPVNLITGLDGTAVFATFGGARLAPGDEARVLISAPLGGASFTAPFMLQQLGTEEKWAPGTPGGEPGQWGGCTITEKLINGVSYWHVCLMN